MEAIMALLDQQNAIYDYLQSVWIPLLKQVNDPDAPFHVNEPSEAADADVTVPSRAECQGVEYTSALFL